MPPTVDLGQPHHPKRRHSDPPGQRAAARAALMEEAAKRLGVDKAELAVADGVITGAGKSVGYGELIGGKRFSITLDPKAPVPTKDPKAYKIVGQPVPRVDILEKAATGTFTYMQDSCVPGMLYGRVVRPPAIGAKLESVDESSVAGIPGLLKVVREGNFLAVVAEGEWPATGGRTRAEGQVVGLGKPAGAGQALRARARDGRSRRRRRRAKSATAPRRSRRA